jgi:hypothetical protein
MPTVAANTLDYYAERTDPDGPAMTDAIHAVDSAQIGEPGRATNTYLDRSIKPFVREPFAQFAEARGNKAGSLDPLAWAPAFDVLTGAGGFAQVFTYGSRASAGGPIACTLIRCCRHSSRVA